MYIVFGSRAIKKTIVDNLIVHWRTRGPAPNVRFKQIHNNKRLTLSKYGVCITLNKASAQSIGIGEVIW